MNAISFFIDGSASYNNTVDTNQLIIIERTKQLSEGVPETTGFEGLLFVVGWLDNGSLVEGCPANGSEIGKHAGLV